MFKPIFAFHPGEDIWEELEARGWTQRQFADIIEISAPELNNIIKGKKNLTPALAVRIGEAFGTSAEICRPNTAWLWQKKMKQKESKESTRNWKNTDLKTFHCLMTQPLKKFCLKKKRNQSRKKWFLLSFLVISKIFLVHFYIKRNISSSLVFFAF